MLSSGPDVSATLQNIEKNTGEIVRWLKYLVITVIVLVVLTAVLI
jgi:hypothetical protein